MKVAVVGFRFPDRGYVFRFVRRLAQLDPNTVIIGVKDDVCAGTWALEAASKYGLQTIVVAPKVTRGWYDRLRWRMAGGFAGHLTKSADLVVVLYTEGDAESGLLSNEVASYGGRLRVLRPNGKEPIIPAKAGGFA